MTNIEQGAVSVADLCCGLGGFSIAARQLRCGDYSMRDVFHIDWDDNAARTTSRALRTEVHHGDMFHPGFLDVCPPHMISCMGIPCQTSSRNNVEKAHGVGITSDSPTYAYLGFIRYRPGHSPAAILFECVDSLTHGECLLTLKVMLAKYALHGYCHPKPRKGEKDFLILNTKDWLNQNRPRVYIPLFLSEKHCRRWRRPRPPRTPPPPWHSDEAGILQTPDELRGHTCWLTDAEVDKRLCPHRPEDQQEVRATGLMFRRDRQHTRKKGTWASNRAHPYRSMCVLRAWQRPSNRPVVLDDGRWRYLTARECARLQGIPDSYKFPNLVKEQGSRHTQENNEVALIGNSVSVPVASAVLLQMLRAMGLADDEEEEQDDDEQYEEKWDSKEEKSNDDDDDDDDDDGNESNEDEESTDKDSESESKEDLDDSKMEVDEEQPDESSSAIPVQLGNRLDLVRTGLRECKARANAPGSVSTLAPGQWLDDEVVNFALSALNYQHGFEDGRMHAFCFNSLEVAARRDLKTSNVSLRHPTATHARDLTCRYWVLPLHCNGNHWSLAVYDTQEPTLYLLDSLSRGALPGATQLPADWTDLPTMLGHTAANLPVVRLPASQQTDGSSCGLFLIEFATVVCQPGWKPQLERVLDVCVRDTAGRIRGLLDDPHWPGLIVVELFAGTGGFSVATESLGCFKTVFANDCSKDSRTIFTANFPGCRFDPRKLKDLLEDHRPGALPPFADLVVAGSPCQPWARGGKRRGWQDERAAEFVRVFQVAQRCHARWVLCENSDELRTMKGGAEFDQLKQHALEYLPQYRMRFPPVPYDTAQHSTLPQKRTRLYCVWFREASDHDRFRFTQPSNLQRRLVSDLLLPEDDVPARFYYRDTIKRGSTSRYPQLFRDQVVQPVRTTQTVYYRDRFKEGGPIVSEVGVLRTIESGISMSSNDVAVILDGRGVRVLTPALAAECFNAQGFPAEYLLPDSLGDNALYKLAGNAVSVPIARLLLESLSHLVANASSTK